MVASMLNTTRIGEPVGGSFNQARTHRQRAWCRWQWAPRPFSASCLEGHRVANFPPKQPLNALQETPSQSLASEEDEEDEPNMGALWLLYTLKGQVVDKKSLSREFLFVDLKVNGKANWARIGSGVTHNFVAELKAKQLGLKLEKDSCHINTVNLATWLIHGKKKFVPMELGHG